MEKIEIILTIIFVATLGSINSLLSYFLDYCFWEGSIFGFWQPFLAKINLKVFAPATYTSLKSANKNKDYNNMLVLAASNMFFFKVLGGCTICSNVWLGFMTFVPITLFLGISAWYAIPYLLFSSFFLRKLLK